MQRHLPSLPLESAKQIVDVPHPKALATQFFGLVVALYPDDWLELRSELNGCQLQETSFGLAAIAM
jgi:hypothetical protein